MSSSVRDDFLSRAGRIERRLAEQKHYTRQKCVEIAGLYGNLKGESLKVAALNDFEEAGIPMKKRDFYVIYRHQVGNCKGL